MDRVNSPVCPCRKTEIVHTSRENFRPGTGCIDICGSGCTRHFDKLAMVTNPNNRIAPGDRSLGKAADHPDGVKKLESDDYYFEDGLMVFTSIYHLRRGYCCENGCRHCPFDEKDK